MPKGDVTPQAYLVKWVMRGSEGSKISKNGRHHLGTAPYYKCRCYNSWLENLKKLQATVRNFFIFIEIGTIK